MPHAQIIAAYGLEDGAGFHNHYRVLSDGRLQRVNHSTHTWETIQIEPGENPPGDGPSFTSKYIDDAAYCLHCRARVTVTPVGNDGILRQVGPCPGCGNSAAGWTHGAVLNSRVHEALRP